MAQREGRPGRVGARLVSLLVVTAVLASAVSVGVGSSAAAGGGCHAPLLEGLTFKLARTIAERAGCRIRVKGSPVTRAQVQTVARQSPAAGGVTSTMTVWLNPACRKGGGKVAPEIHEPHIKAGPAELISGFYLVGGPPPHYFSAPKCPRHPEPPPGPGTVVVLDASGAVLATQTSVASHFVEIPLAPGSYTVRGTFLDTTRNGTHPTKSETVVIPAGHTVRQDFLLNVP